MGRVIRLLRISGGDDLRRYRMFVWTAGVMWIAVYCVYYGRLYDPTCTLDSTHIVAPRRPAVFPSRSRHLSDPEDRSKLTPLPQVYPFSRTGYYALDPKIPPEEQKGGGKVWVSVGMEPK